MVKIGKFLWDVVIILNYCWDFWLSTNIYPGKLIYIISLKGKPISCKPLKIYRKQKARPLINWIILLFAITLNLIIPTKNTDLSKDVKTFVLNYSLRLHTFFKIDILEKENCSIKINILYFLCKSYVTIIVLPLLIKVKVKNN